MAGVTSTRIAIAAAGVLAGLMLADMLGASTFASRIGIAA